MKEPSFYCENCGKPVALRANRCPSCGRAFEAVKCPECGFAGKAALFSDGCPTCGYMSSFASSSAAGIVEVGLDDDLDAVSVPAEPEKRKRPLPGWAYSLITIGLIIFLVVLMIIYFNLD